MTQEENLALFKKTGKFIPGVCRNLNNGWNAYLIRDRYYYEMLGVGGENGSMKMSDVTNSMLIDRSYNSYIPEPFNLSSDVVI